jgi:alcohol dehydrogenase class IV
VIAGSGALSSAYKSMVDLGGRRAMIITDEGVRKAGLADLVKGTLGDFFAGLYDKIPSDPDLDSVQAAVEAAIDLKADCIVSVGGGSVIDSAKGVCVTLKNGGKITDHVRQSVLIEPQTPHICIPTTSGTGSEVTRDAVLTNKSSGRKVFISDQAIVPNVAILDPRMTISLPSGLTASTAMDALTHAVESVTSSWNNPVCDALALHAIRLITENLLLVITDGKNEKARLNMQIAATLAGWAFSVAHTGLAHAMAHTVGTLYHVPHGVGCGIMLPKVMRYNVDHCTDQLVRVAEAMKVNITGKSKRDAAMSAADAVEDLMLKSGPPRCLHEVGVPTGGFDILAMHAFDDVCTMFNGRMVSDPNDIANLYKEAY